MTTKQKLLDAGLTLFLDVGYDGATVAAICTKAGVSNGSFFHAFRNKEALAAELFIAALADYHDALLLVLKGKPNARDGIDELIGAHLNWVETNERYARLLFDQVRPELRSVLSSLQMAENDRFIGGVDAWRLPLQEKNILINQSRLEFMALLVGPAQIIIPTIVLMQLMQPLATFRQNLTRAAVRSLTNLSGLKN